MKCSCNYFSDDIRNGRHGGIASNYNNGRRQRRRATQAESGPSFRGLNAAGESVFHEPRHCPCRASPHVISRRTAAPLKADGFPRCANHPRGSQLEFQARSSVVVRSIMARAKGAGVTGRIALTARTPPHTQVSFRRSPALGPVPGGTHRATCSSTCRRTDRAPQRAANLSRHHQRPHARTNGSRQQVPG